MKINLIEIKFVYYFNPNFTLINDTIDFYDNIKEKIFENIKAIKINNLLTFPDPDQPILNMTDSNNSSLQFKRQRCDFIFKEKDKNNVLNIGKFKNICNETIAFLIEKQFMFTRLGAIATFENIDFSNSKEMLKNIGINNELNNETTFNLLFGKEIILADKKIFKYTRFIKQEKLNKLIIQKDFNTGISNNQQLSNEFISLFKTNFFDELTKKEW